MIKKQRKILVIVIAIIFLLSLIFVFINSDIFLILRGKETSKSIKYLSGRVDKMNSEQEDIKNIQCNTLDNAITNAQLKGGIIDADIKTFEQLIDKININLESSPEEAKIMWQERLSEVQKMEDNFKKIKNRCQ